MVVFPNHGEISLAHHGVLFLDELPEFGKNTLEVMRGPLEDEKVTIRKFMSGQKDRDTILNDFASGKLQVLTSMKCLDEGFESAMTVMTLPKRLRLYFRTSNHLERYFQRLLLH